MWSGGDVDYGNYNVYNFHGRDTPGTEYLKWGICINEYGDIAGIFNMNGIESSYGKNSPYTGNDASGRYIAHYVRSSGVVFDDYRVTYSYGRI